MQKKKKKWRKMRLYGFKNKTHETTTEVNVTEEQRTYVDIKTAKITHNTAKERKERKRERKKRAKFAFSIVRSKFA